MITLERICVRPETAIYLFNLAVAVGLASGAGLAATLLCRKSAAPLRHGILLSVLGLALLSPVLVWVAAQTRLSWIAVAVSEPKDLGRPIRPAPPREAPSRRPGIDPMVTLPSPPTSIDESPLDGGLTEPVDHPPHKPVVSEEAIPESTAGHWLPQAGGSPSTLGWWRIAGTLWLSVWMLGVLARAVLLGRGWLLVARLRHWLEPSRDRRLERMVRTAAGALGLRQAPPVFSSPSLTVPLSLGLLRPVLVLPKGIEQETAHEALQALLLHETAHIVRGDRWVGLAQRVAALLYWWNPLIHRVNDCLSELREEICDGYVLRVQGDGRRFAELLVEIAARTGLGARVPFGIGVLPPKLDGLHGRITRLLDKERNVITRMNLSSTVAVVAFGTVLAGVLLVSSVRAAGKRPETPDAAVTPLHDGDAGPATEPAARGAGLKAPAAGDSSVAMLARQIEPVLRNANQQGVKKLIGELDDDRFSVRERASKQLAMMGRWPEARLRTALRKTESEEARARLRRLIRAAESPTAASDGQRWMVRAVWVLEQTATAEAKALLRSIEQSPVSPQWRRFQAGKHVVEAGFLPDKAEYVWGEPMFYFTFVVKNVGPAPLQFTDGGDDRGGRSEGHKITAVDARGKAVPAPEMPMRGGIMGVRTLAPGGVYLKMLPVSRRLTFSGPGVYTVTGQRALQLGGLDRKPPAQALPIATSFRLTIHPYSEARMREVVENLAAQIRAAGDLAPKPLEYTEPTSMSEANRLYLAMSALAGIKDAAVETHFVAMGKDALPKVRAAALVRLGKFASGEALAALLEALEDRDEAIRGAAAAGLGAMKSDAAVDALLAALPKQNPAVAAAILRAMGHTRSPRVFQVLVRSLSEEDTQFRRGAVAGLVAFGGAEAVKALKACAGDDDLDFRELVVRTLAESLRQPIDAQWLVPVIRSRRGTRSIGDAPRLLRLFAADQAAPALLSCLDFENPAVRSYYNWSIITSQLACRGGLVIPWNADLNRDGTPEEIQQNRRSLKIIKSWINQYYKSDWQEPPEPWRRGREVEEQTWGQPADDLSIRAWVNRHYWPAGMPQVVRINARSQSGGGSIRFAKKPDPFEVEVNGHWYQHDPKAEMVVFGEWGGYYGNRYHDIQLNDRWLRKADNRPLELEPGKYSLRVRLSTAAKDRQTGLATSRPVHFQVIATD